jgi:predicted glycoside hydrolase/deacetylase ChbG (UPF0249 family)
VLVNAGRLRTATVQAIVNADDLGLSTSVNHGILRGHEDGIVTSASFLANGEASEEAARLALAAPALEIGLHLNFTEGRPLTAARSLLGADGLFRSVPRQIAALMAGRVRAGDVAVEAEAQLRRARELGLSITHLNGHHWIYLVGVARRVVFSLARMEGLVLRRPRESSLAGLDGSVVYGARRLALRAASAGPAWRGMLATDAFVDLTGPRRGRSPAWLVDELRGRRGVVEVMCHPGMAGGPAGDPLHVRRSEELALLTAPGLRAALVDAGVALTTFHEALGRK